MDPPKKEKSLPITNELKDFCLSTSAHGYGYLTKGTTISRICWGVILISALTATVGHLYALTKKYLEYDYYEVVTVKPDDMRTFPEVTICDTVGISDYAISRHERTRAIFKHLLATREYMFSQFKNLTETHDENTIKYLWNNLLGPKYVFANTPSSERTSIGTMFDSLVADCKFAEQTCNAENFELFVNPRYLNCYTFKPQTINAKYGNILLGPEFGLSLILKGEPTLDDKYYNISNVQNTNSVHVHIHPRNTMPFVSSDGLHINPGMSTFIELNQKEFTRLEAPYSDCQPNRNITALSKNYLLEPGYCFADCIRKKLYETCNCVSTMSGGVSEDHTKHCMYLDTSDKSNLNFSKIVCELETLLHFERNEKVDCERCQWNCKETKYDAKISQAEWPRAVVVKDFMDKYVRSKPRDNPIREYYEHMTKIFNASEEKTRMERSMSLKDISETLSRGLLDEDSVFANLSVSPYMPDTLLQSASLVELQRKWVQESFYRLNIYFSEPFVTCHTQVPSISLEDFWSGIGGVLGLWAGASVLTVLEIFSFCAHVIFTKNQ